MNYEDEKKYTVCVDIKLEVNGVVGSETDNDELLKEQILDEFIRRVRGTEAWELIDDWECSLYSIEEAGRDEEVCTRSY